MKFNQDKYYLGKLCKRGHGWEDSGMSLRLIRNGDCRSCIAQRKTSPEYKKWKKGYDLNYNKNKRDQSIAQKYRKTHKKEFAAYGKEYRQTERFKKNNKVNSTRMRKSLRGDYVKGLVKKQFKSKKSGLGIEIKNTPITHEMIGLKREQVLLHRLIKEAKNGLNRARN